jgi:tetratricopeptide (TPR) repeat protein
MKKILLIISILFQFCSFSQEGSDLQLSQYYFSKGDFEKALPYCQKVFNKDNSKFNFKRYYECLVGTNKEKEAEKLLKKQVSLFKEDFEYSILLGDLYLSKGDEKEAKKLFNELIEQYGKNSYSVIDLYQAFKVANKTEYAFQTLEKGRKTFKDKLPLHLQFAEVYKTKGEIDKMIQEYVDFLEIETQSLDLIQLSLSQQIDFTNENSKEYELLKDKLLAKIQKKPNETIYAEMLIWLFVQKKLFNAALTQAKALDKRELNDGFRVIEIGNICLENKDYETARKAYKHILTLGEDKQFYFQAEYLLLNTRFTEITTLKNYSLTEIKSTLEEYEQVINRIGFNIKSQRILLEYAQILAFYANQSEKASETLKKALEIPGLTSMQNAELKMLLADIYVFMDDVWESSLLYMQIDKAFKFEPIGFEAKFKNARIFYYDGDFKFAQSQLDVLKQSTTKLIANDALKLSIFITDNYGLDSNYTAMSQFAQADLYLQQHKYELAFKLFDSISEAFPYHSLSDEIMYRKATAYIDQGKWNEAIKTLEELLKFHSEDILADDAVFQLANIYETILFNNEKATELYKKLLFDYKGSLYSSEARKRLRILRGDKIEDDSL